MKSLKQGLQIAKQKKNDEFYTQLSDIEKELKHYRKHFKGKVVYCNCDDPKVSNFFHYFTHNFEKLGIKKLITTCYKNQNSDLFSQHDSERAICMQYVGGGGKKPDLTNTCVYSLKGDGDFRSDECIELLKQADIVVTNPPFSLFREYVAQLMEYGKEFLTIGNVNAVAYKEIFPLIKNNQIWLGHSIKSGDREFGVPNHYPLKAASSRVDENGRKFIRVKGVRWFTNLEFQQRYEDLILYEKYTPGKYPKYDNYDAIDVNRTRDIPMDYKGEMGVPLTFLDKHNPDQFEVVSFRKGKDGKDLKVNGKEKFIRIIIRRKKP